MKVLNGFIFIVFALLFTSCDRVELPYDGNTGPVTGGVQGVPRKVIVEDFTGFRCVNCPLASETLKQLQEDVYGDQMIPIAVHMMDFFAEPQADPSYPGYFLKDFRTVDGAEYESTFSVFGIPIGMVNRTEDNSNLLIGFGAWDGKIAEILANPADVEIKIKDASFDPGSQQVNVEIDAILANNIDGDYNITVCLVEDSIVDAQYDGSDVITDYIHRHVFRGSLNTSWGEPIFSDAAAGDSIRFENSFSLPSSINSAPNPNPEIDMSKCEIVAYIYNSGFGEYEIIQAEKKHVEVQ